MQAGSSWMFWQKSPCLCLRLWQMRSIVLIVWLNFLVLQPVAGEPVCNTDAEEGEFKMVFNAVSVPLKNRRTGGCCSKQKTGKDDSFTVK
ncbi:MAG: hypothetical protein ACOYJD_09765 [Christensenellales bacterium]|jgi:hypothetical protein